MFGYGKVHLFCLFLCERNARRIKTAIIMLMIDEKALSDITR